MDQERLQYLFQRYINETCSEKELEELRLILKHPGREENLKKLLDAAWEHLEEKDMRDVPPAKAEAIYKEIVSRQQYRKKTGTQFWFAAAAAILIFLSSGIGLYHYYHRSQPVESHLTGVKPEPEEIIPGSNKAVLTLADGRKIILNDADKGQLAIQENVEISKVDDGQLVYSAHAGVKNGGSTQLNTITTPRGGQFRITLPDGSKVWLNAESSLKYPIAFTGRERRVEMSGEAYFEVAKNLKQPFIVTANGMEIKVLGTHFNVMAYDDEKKMITTLLEGSVNVGGGSEDVMLKPGQQSLYSRNGGSIKIRAGNPEEAVAWKNGYFMFKNENIQSIMRKIARWYDVEVEYRGDIKRKAFGGTISKFENVSEVLKTMELTGTIQFKIEGRRIIVME